MSMTKKALIAGAFLTAAGIAGTATAGAPVVYGKANISVNFDDTEASNTDTVKWNSNASRLGVKGKHKLENGLEAFYKAEFEIQFDDGDKGGNTSSETFTQRNIYAGVKGGFGAVKAGRFDTPSKIALKPVDLFNDYKLGDIKQVWNGDNRESNMIQYSSKNMSGVQFHIAAQAGEKTGANSDNGVADAISGSVVYKADNLYLALSHDSETDGADTSLTRLVAQYKIDAVKLGAAVQMYDYTDTVDTTGFILSAAYKAGKNTYKIQYTTENEADGGVAAITSGGAIDDEDNDTMITLGMEHKMSNKVKVYGYYSNYDVDDNVDDATDQNTFGAGFEVKF